jgi:hypothetical protein
MKIHFSTYYTKKKADGTLASATAIYSQSIKSYLKKKSRISLETSS